MRWWRILGVAGFAGVAAGGVLIARDERRRQTCSPDEIREHLHARLTSEPTSPGAENAPPETPAS